MGRKRRQHKPPRPSCTVQKTQDNERAFRAFVYMEARWLAALVEDRGYTALVHFPWGDARTVEWLLINLANKVLARGGASYGFLP